MKLNEPIQSDLDATDPGRVDWLWFSVAMLVIAISGFALRHGTNILNLDEVRDESLMRVPIADILEEDWSKRAMFDYQEVKGPTFYWGYALAAELLGDSMNDLRLVSVLCFVLTGIPLLLIASRVGVRGPPLLVVAALYVLLPYNVLVSQMLMSEPSFILLGMWLMWAFVWGFGTSPQDEKRIAGPVLFAVLLSLLLHHRPHAVAFAGAAALVAFERDRLRSWPWWAACVAAGLSRIPLWLYWGGLVTSHYQELFTFGLSIECQTYLLASLLVVSGVFLWPALTRPAYFRRWPWLLLGSVVGFALGLLFPPDLSAKVEYVLPGTGGLKQQAAFAGILTTTLRVLAPSGFLHQIALTVLPTLGGASVAAMFIMTFDRRVSSSAGIVWRLAFWTLAVGIPMYLITSGPVYDRYLQVWMLLLPILWLWSLPRWLLIAYILVLVAMAAHFVMTYFN